MQFSNLNLFIKTNDISVQKTPINGRFLSLCVLSENDLTLSSISHSNFSPVTAIKNLVVPNSNAPYKTYMNASYKQDIQGMGYIPIKTDIPDMSKIINKHFYVDITRYLNEISERLNITNFNNSKYKELFDLYTNYLYNNTNPKYEKVLLYTIDLNKPFSDKLSERKILPLYINLLHNSKNNEFHIPFDKILFCKYNSSIQGSKEFTLIYDKTKKLNISRLRDIITSDTYENKSVDIENDEEMDSDMLNFQEDEIRNAVNFKEALIWKKGSLVFLEAAPLVKPAVYNPSNPAFINPLQPNPINQPFQVAPVQQPVQQPVVAAPVAPVQQPVVAAAPAAPVQTMAPNSASPFSPSYDPINPPVPLRMPNNGMSKTTKNVLGAAAVAGAGIAAFMQFRKAQNKKLEKWYETNCDNLKGGSKKACIKHVNNIKLNNLNQLLAYCNNDQTCIAGIKQEIEQLQANIKKSQLG